MELQPGQTIIGGKYRIERLLGSGAFAKVYLATHVLLKAPVAVKVLHKDAPGIGSAEFGRFRERFLQEAQLGKRLKHPNVVRVDDFIEDEGVFYLVMEFCAGGSLKDRLDRARKSGQAVPVAEAVRLALDVARGLAALHVIEVVHRDLKPSNILFDAEGHAFVADLGLAQTRDNLSQRTLLGSQARPQPGTPGYMSPEQAENYPHLAPSSDIYNLGIVLFEMLTGHLYDNERHPTRVKSLRADVPPWLDKLVASMLSWASTARPRNGAIAARLLEEEKWQIKADEQAPTAAEKPAVAAQALAKDPTPPIPAPARVDPTPPPPPRKRGLPGWALIGIGVAVVALLALGVAEVSRGGPSAAATAVARKTAASPTTVLTATPTMIGTPPALVTAMKDTATPTETATPTPTVAAGATRVREMDGAVMVYVPAGEFAMGSASDDSQAYDWEVPQQRVKVAGFWIDRTEVTNGQYRKFMEAGGYDKEEYWTEAGWAWKQRNMVPPGCWSDGRLNQAQQPVVCVRWYEASAYAHWVGGRLPTEAEWEKAARGTDGRLYPWGNASPDCGRLNFWRKDPGCVGRTSPVGSYAKGVSPYGALDMAGNAWEWVSSEFRDYPYESDDGREDQSGTAVRVLRGGSWLNFAPVVRSAARLSYNPDKLSNNFGFRVASSDP